MALNGIIQKKGAVGGVGILTYDNDNACIIYYNAPNSTIDQTPGSPVQFNIHSVEVTVQKTDGSSFTSSEDIAILVKQGKSTEVEELDDALKDGKGLASVIRLNHGDGEDPPKADAPVGDGFSYRFGIIAQPDEEGKNQDFYFDRISYPNIVKTVDSPYFITRSAKFLDPDQMLDGQEGSVTANFFAKEITTVG